MVSQLLYYLSFLVVMDEKSLSAPPTPSEEVPDIANRKLPELPPEAYGSKISRIWSSIRDRLTKSGRLRRSQSADASTSRGGLNQPTPLPYSTYYKLISNHQTMVLPGLRQFPPPIEDDDDSAVISNRVSLPACSTQASPDYADIEIYQERPGVNADASGSGQRSQDEGLPGAAGPPVNHDYHDISDLPRPKTVVPLRLKPARRNITGSKTASLATSINTLHHQGWYWGPLNREETEKKLKPLSTGSFLVRDSNDAHHLYTLSFKQNQLILHTRIEFVNGVFTFFLSEARAKETGKPSVEALINSAMTTGVKGEFGDSRRIRGVAPRPPIKIILSQPVSRFSEVRSLQFLCKFALRANMNRDDVVDLPLPVHVKSWVHEQNYF